MQSTRRHKAFVSHRAADASILGIRPGMANKNRYV